jgi:hypothetical protein
MLLLHDKFDKVSVKYFLLSSTTSFFPWHSLYPIFFKKMEFISISCIPFMVEIHILIKVN